MIITKKGGGYLNHTQLTPSKVALNTSGQYDPKLIAKMAADPDFFHSLLPRVIHEFVNIGPSEAEGSTAYHHQTHMHLPVRKLWDLGPQTLLVHLHDYYLRETGKLDKKIDELTTEIERTNWENYLQSLILPRQKALDLLDKIVHLNLPRVDLLKNSMRYSPDMPNTYFLHGRLQSVPYRLALNVIPDMSEEEATQLFGESLNEVHRKSIDPAETQVLM